MPEKTGRWTTMLDGNPNDDSGGTDYLRGQSCAHPTNSMMRGASIAAEWIGLGCSTRLRASTEESDSAAWVFGSGACRVANRKIVVQFIILGGVRI
jgi:hypothetical protein